MSILKIICTTIAVLLLHTTTIVVIGHVPIPNSLSDFKSSNRVVTTSNTRGGGSNPTKTTTTTTTKGGLLRWPYSSLSKVSSSTVSSSSSSTIRLKDTFPTESLLSNDDDDESESDLTTGSIVDSLHNEIDLSFENIELIVTKSKKKSSSSSSSSSDDRSTSTNYKILDGSIRGRAKPGRLLAIMGPSGSGKSSILHALAGRIKESTKLSLYGTRYVNGQAITNKRDEEILLLSSSALVEQDVTFFPYMTVYETISFRVELQYGTTLSYNEREQIVINVLQQMSLLSIADTIVGNNKIRGISGGERKRLSIAVELISSPSILFLDEPTSGLDSTGASTLVQQLRTLADIYHKTIIAVIHQPSQHVFTMFDDLLLVGHGGKLMYYGERNKVRHYMEYNIGCKASNDIGTAEYILDCITVAPILSLGEISIDDATIRFNKLATIAQTLSIDLGIKGSTSSQASNALKNNDNNTNILKKINKANIIKQFRLLLKRSIQEIVRGKTTIILKLIQQITTAFIYGSIYSVQSNNQASIRDRFGLLNLLIIGTTNLALSQTIRSFPKEKIIVSTEIASKLYNTIPYFLAKAISEIPVSGILSTVFGSLVYYLTGLDRTDKQKFLKFISLLVLQCTVSEAAGLFIGSISPSSDIALALFPAIVVLSIIFDGKSISEENTPRHLRWISKIGLMRWGYEGLVVNEFTGLQFNDGTDGTDTVISRKQSSSSSSSVYITKTGTDALHNFGLGTRTIKDVITAQSIIITSCWLLSYIGLSITKQKYETMKTNTNN